MKSCDENGKYNAKSKTKFQHNRGLKALLVSVICTILQTQLIKFLALPLPARDVLLDVNSKRIDSMDINRVSLARNSESSNCMVWNNKNYSYDKIFSGYSYIRDIPCNISHFKTKWFVTRSN